MKVLIDKNNVVIAKSNEIKKVKNGFFIEEENAVYSENDLILIETKLNPRLFQDKIVNGKIEINLNYKSFEDLKKELLLKTK
jgi:DNA-binding sugar fermentation-stimulating protein